MLSYSSIVLIKVLTTYGILVVIFVELEYSVLFAFGQ